ncbi:MAG: hypothetical protein ABL967_09045 [Bryobacteraceae bacterium]
MTSCKPFLAFLFAVAPVWAQGSNSTSDALQARIRELETQVAKLTRDQQATNEVLKSVSEFLKKLEGSNSGMAAVPCSQQTYPAAKLAFMEIVLKGCVGLSANADSLTFALSLKNITEQPIFVGATCCYAEWLKVVDNNGRNWQSDQWSLTRLPVGHDKDLVEIAPGAEIAISGRFKPTERPPRGEDNPIPRTISITGELLRRSESEQRLVDRSGCSICSQGGHPFTFGIPSVPVGSK